jgi:ATP-binding cassette subfamily B (MDR/TAP) protein 1
VESVRGEIDFRHVDFAYPTRPDVMVFKDFSLRIRAGQSQALVGASGSGKSTVIALIERFYDPLAGKVMVDGKDIRRLNLKSLRLRIGLVQQEPVLFATSILENIAYGRDGATEEEVVEAAKVANVHGFVSALPDGYRTPWASAGCSCPAGRSSASRSRAPCSRTPPCCCWTRRPARWTPSPSACCRRRWSAS